jgi:hypothetical protein
MPSQPDCEILSPQPAEILPAIADLGALVGSRGRPGRRLLELGEAALVEAATLIRPAAIWRQVRAGDLGSPEEKALLPLSEGQEAISVLCSIGEALERRSRECFDGRDSALGYFLDLIGTACVARLARKVAADLLDGRSARRWAPGDDPEDPSMTAQRLLFGLLPAERIGVRLTAHNVMLPVKSLSFVLILGAGGSDSTCGEHCDRCAWQGDCGRAVTEKATA